MSQNSMSRADRASAMNEAKEQAEAKVQRYNEITQIAWDGGEYDPKELVQVQEDIDKACADFNHHSKILTYLDCQEAAKKKNLLTAEVAASILRYPTIGCKDTKISDELCPVREIIPKVRDIDLIDLDKTLGGGACASKDWKSIAQHLNHLIVYASCIQIGADAVKVRDCFALREIEAAIKRGEKPLSKANIREEFKKAIRAIIGDTFIEQKIWDTVLPEYDIEGNPLTVGDTAVNYTVRVFSKKGRKALSVACGNVKQTVQILMDICHRLITGASFSVESKDIKDDAAPKAPKVDTTPSTADAGILDEIENFSDEQLKALSRAIRKRKAALKEESAESAE